MGLETITWTREIKENGDYEVSFIIPEEIFREYEEEEIVEYLTYKLSELLEVKYE